MRAVDAIKNKAAVTVLLCVILGLVFLNHINERTNATKINKAIATIYDDRLVVEGYIFDYAQHLQHIIEITGNPAADKALTAYYMNEIKSLNSLYEKTRLTEDEKASYGKFISFYDNMGQSIKANNFDGALQYAKAAKSVLPVLSDIQVKEAATEMDGLQKLFGASSMSLQFEVAVLAIITFLILALQFTTRTISSNSFPKSPSLN